MAGRGCVKLAPKRLSLTAMPLKTQLLEAVSAALADDWQRAHEIVQQHDDPIACWIHAVLHKVEGDAGNSRYWYAQSAHAYGEFADVGAEWAAIRQALEGEA